MAGRRWQTLLNVDGLELYFAERRQNLYMLIIVASRIVPGAESNGIDFGWINRELTLDAVRQQLAARSWPGTEHSRPDSAAPTLLVGSQAAFHFFDAADDQTTHRLAKIILHHSPEAAAAALARPAQFARNQSLT